MKERVEQLERLERFEQADEGGFVYANPDSTLRYRQ
jgi:hypothetical protein